MICSIVMCLYHPLRKVLLIIWKEISMHKTSHVNLANTIVMCLYHPLRKVLLIIWKEISMHKTSHVNLVNRCLSTTFMTYIRLDPFHITFSYMVRHKFHITVSYPWLHMHLNNNARLYIWYFF
jgi:hypothetical protein